MCAKNLNFITDHKEGYLDGVCVFFVCFDVVYELVICEIFDVVNLR